MGEKKKIREWQNFISIVSRNLCNFAAKRRDTKGGESKCGFLGSEGSRFQIVVNYPSPNGLHV